MSLVAPELPLLEPAEHDDSSLVRPEAEHVDASPRRPDEVSLSVEHTVALTNVDSEVCSTEIACWSSRSGSMAAANAGPIAAA